MIVRDDDERCPRRAGLVVQQLHRGELRQGIQISRRLICEDQARLCDHGAADRDSLTFSLRQLCHRPIQEFAKPHRFRERPRPGSHKTIECQDAVNHERKQNVLDEPQRFEQFEILEDLPGGRDTKSSPLGVAHRSQLSITDSNRARNRFQNPGENLKQRRLATSAGASDREVLVRSNLQGPDSQRESGLRITKPDIVEADQ